MSSAGVGACDDAPVEAADETAREAAAMLRRVLEAVGQGDLTAGTPQATALVRRIAGVMVARRRCTGGAPGGARREHFRHRRHKWHNALVGRNRPIHAQTRPFSGFAVYPGCMPS